MCDNPPVRVDELDEAVWNEVLTLLENPQLIQAEINRRIAAANDTTTASGRIDALRGELARNKSQCGRSLDAYQGGLVTLDELRARNAPLQTRQRSILSELKALQTVELDRESQLTLATTVEQFLVRMREGTQSLSLAERQRVVRLLIREVRIGKESVTICHSIPMGSVSPEGSDRRGGVPALMARDQGALLIPRCGQVVQQKRVVVQMALGQALLDGMLASQQPVHGGIQLILVDCVEAKQVAQGGGRFPGSGRGQWRITAGKMPIAKI